MGCEVCRGEKPDLETGRNISEVERVRNELDKECEGGLKLRQGNYVMLSVGKLTEMYDVLEQIGEGAFGSVYRGRHKRLGQYRAIKSLWTEKMTKRQQERLLGEVTLLKEMVGGR